MDDREPVLLHFGLEGGRVVDVDNGVGHDSSLLVTNPVFQSLSEDDEFVAATGPSPTRRKTAEHGRIREGTITLGRFGGPMAGQNFGQHWSVDISVDFIR